VAAGKLVIAVDGMLAAMEAEPWPALELPKIDRAGG
jgi:hypothetical protein